MPYTVTLATAEDRDLVVGCLRSAADQRTNVARKAAAEVARDRAAKLEHRSSAVKVAILLAQSDALVTLADELAAATELPVLRAVGAATPTGQAVNGLTDEQLNAALSAADTDTPAPVPPAMDLNVAIATVLAAADGTSPEAQQLAATAGLVEDPETGVAAEDVPGAAAPGVPADVVEVTL